MDAAARMFVRLPKSRRMIFVAGLVSSFIGVYVSLTYPPPGVTWDNYEKIREGMTKEEVLAILWGPTTHQIPPVNHARVDWKNGPIADYADEYWESNGYRIHLGWNSKGGTCFKEFWVVPEPGRLRYPWFLNWLLDRRNTREKDGPDMYF